MPSIILCGSNNSNRIGILDFRTAGAPSGTFFNTGVGGGLRVALDGSNAAFGNFNGNQIGLVDITNPAAPVLLRQVNSGLSGVGAIAVRGTRVAVGELTANRVALFDLALPAGMEQIGVFSSMTANFFGSIAFLTSNIVVAAGPNDSRIARIDFSVPASPALTVVNSGLGGGLSIAADAGNSQVVVGNQNGAEIRLFDGTGATLTLVGGSINTMLPGVNSVAISGDIILAGTNNGFEIAKINRLTRAVVRQNVGNASSNVVGVGGIEGVAVPFSGGSAVVALDVSGANIVLGDSFNIAALGIASITTVGISPAVVAPPMMARLSLSATALNFAVTRVGQTSNLGPTLNNTGNAPLNVNAIAVSGARFSLVNPPANNSLTIPPGGSAMLTVRFSPNAVGSVSGSLTFTTNDPMQANVTVMLSGVGAVPTISLNQNPLNLPAVPVCQSLNGMISIGNTGGVPLTINSITAAPANSPFTVTGVPNGTVIPAGGSTNLNIRFAPSVVGNASITITIASDDPNNPSRQVTVNGVGTPRPAPALTSDKQAIAFGNVRVQDFIGVRFTLTNPNPCVPLNITLTPSGGPYAVVPDGNLSGGQIGAALNDSVAAGQHKTFIAVFHADAVGAATPGQITVSGAETGNAANTLNPNVVITLTGTGVAITATALELVLDRSGSMSDPTPGGTKMDDLKRTVSMFADLLRPGQGDEIGVVEFDDARVDPAPARVLTHLSAVDAAQITQVKTDVNTLTPRGATGIGAGLQLGLNEVSASAVARKAILVFTDGKENQSPSVAQALPAVVAAGAEAYAIGLGQGNEIDSQILSDLAITTGGNFFASNDTLILRKNFVQVLANAFRQSMAADPVFRLRQGAIQDTAVRITGCERRITFVAAWDDPNAQVTLEVIAPDGTVYDAASVTGNQLARYQFGPGYKAIAVALPRIQGTNDIIGPQTPGIWLLRLTGGQIGAQGVRCTTNIFVESAITMRTWVEAPDANRPLRVWAEIMEDGKRVCGANVRVTVRSPQRNLFEVLTPQVLNRALKAKLVYDDISLQLTDLAIQSLIGRGKTLIRKTQSSYTMTQQPDCRYLVEIPATGNEGVYDITVTAEGAGCGATFQRYSSFNVFVPRKPSGTTTVVVVTPIGTTGVTVVVTPHDSGGVPMGPGLGNTISAAVEGAQVTGIYDRRDGSYAIQITRTGKQMPRRATIRIGETQIPISLRRSGGKTSGSS